MATIVAATTPFRAGMPNSKAFSTCSSSRIQHEMPSTRLRGVGEQPARLIGVQICECAGGDGRAKRRPEAAAGVPGVAEVVGVQRHVGRVPML